MAVFTNGIKDPEIARLSWIIQESQCPSKKEAEGDLIHRGGEGYVKTEAEI